MRDREAQRTSAVFLAIALLVLSLPFGCSTEMPSAEATALKTVRDMGGMAVLGQNGTHVATLMVTSVTTPDLNDRIDVLVPELPKFKHLTHLEVTNADLTNEHMKSIGSLRRVNSLVLSGTQISDEGVQHVANLPLKSFYLANTKITPVVMDTIAKIDTLEILDVSGSDALSNAGPLRDLEHLEWLVAKRVSVPSESIDILSEVPNLKRLSLDDSSINAADLQRLRSAKPQLQIDGIDSPDGEAAETAAPAEISE